MIKVIVVDDQQLLRESIGYLLENDSEIEVVGMGGDGEEAIALCRALSPDVVLMDIEMPGMNGICATRAIKQQFPEVKLIILTTFENPDNIMEAFVNDADGYIVKNISHRDLVRSIKCVHSGLTVIDKSVKLMMIERFRGLCAYKAQYADSLTDRELAIVRHIASGLSNKEIAAALAFSQGTIKNDVSKILEKLSLSDRMQIAIFAIENGIV